MKIYNLAVTELAIPTPRLGSIDSYSGFGVGSASKRAQKAHQNFQNTQIEQNKNYIAEMSVSHNFVFMHFKFHITGRIDGVYQEEVVRIEEIKTAFEPFKLIKVLADNYYTHPYWLQLQLYGYIQFLKTGVMPKLNLLIISLRNHKIYPIPLNFNQKLFELWLNKRFEALVEEIENSKKRMQRRKKIAQKLIFPFSSPRSQQKELMESVFQSMQQKNTLLVQAPTGLGKTMAILFPALHESLLRGQKIIYITPKNSQHKVALDAVKKIQAQGAFCKSLILTAKKKLCMKNEPICSSKHCEFAYNHYFKCSEAKLLQKMQKKKNLDSVFFKKLAVSARICPYELQMQAIPYTDVLIADYNYAFSSAECSPPVVAKLFGEIGKPNLIIDEIHNLPARGMEYFSPVLNLTFFEQLSNPPNLPITLKKKFKKLSIQCLEIVHECITPGRTDTHLVTINEQLFKKQEDLLNHFLSEYLALDISIESGDNILKLSNYWSDFTAALEYVKNNKDKFFVAFYPAQNLLKITCCDGSDFLKTNYNHFEHIVGFSATLKPFEYYSQLSGLEKCNLDTQEFTSSFPKENRKLLIIPQISTKFQDRQQHYNRIIEVINRITSLKLGNYFVFFPSFHFMEQVYQLMKELSTSTSFFQLLKQERGMTAGAVQSLHAQLSQKNTHYLFFAVQGGSFSEGIDYSGELAIGAFVIGPAVAHYDWEREQMKKYYEKHYKKGREYAYIYPAMAKSIQAAGRVIRSETDKGLLVFLDNRFLAPLFSECMPQDWFIKTPQELVSTSILKDIETFWNKTNTCN